MSGLFQEGVKELGSEVKEEDCLAIIAIKTGGGGRCNQLEELRRNQGNQRRAQSHPVTNCEERLELSLLPFHTAAHTTLDHTAHCTTIVQFHSALNHQILAEWLCASKNALSKL